MSTKASPPSVAFSVEACDAAYPDGDDDISELGRECFLCEQYVAKSWSKLYSHFRQKHGVEAATMVGASLHRSHRKEEASREGDRRRSARDKQGKAGALLVRRR